MIGVIADDLTGAMDAAAPFAERGLRATVFPSVARLPPEPPSGFDLVAVNLDCRHMSDEAAIAQVGIAKQWLRAPERLFLKVDSTLRGPIIAMVRAAASARQSVIVAPAVPAQGRTVRDGRVHVDGVPLGESAVARDPRAPPFADDLPDSFGLSGATMPDVQSDADLDRLLQNASGNALLVGAAGLAAALARLRPERAISSPPLLSPHPKALFVVGSHHPASRAQYRALRAARPDLTVLGTPAERVDPEVALTQLSGRALTAIRKTRPTFIVATGGELANAILNGLGVDQLEVLSPPKPGLCQATIHSGDRCHVIVTKAGGFGQENLLVEFAQEMHL